MIVRGSLPRLAVLVFAMRVCLVGSAAPGGESIPLTATGRSIRPGEVVVLTAVVSGPVDAVSIRAFGHTIPAFHVTGATWKALVGIDVDVRPGRFPIVADAPSGGVGRTRHGETTLVVRPRAFPTRQLTVDAAFVNPPPEAEGRIVREAEQLNALWAASAPARLWTGSFVAPVTAPASSRFGLRSIFNGQPRSRHSGEDFASREGTPVAAPNAGRIVLARELYFAGNTVVIDHGLGCFSLLEHLSRVDVKEGDQVRSGQPIGLVGATGRVTGPHLHWAVRLNGARVDPLSLLASRVE